MSDVELDGVLIVIFLKITDAPLRFMIVTFHGCEGTGKGAVLCQDCSNATHPTDAGLSKAEREAKEAIADQEDAQRILLANVERLRKERLARETAARPMFYPVPELPDDIPIENVRFSTRVRNALTIAGLKTSARYERHQTRCC